ncbi:hypothetical protein C8R41DRAFT_32055 [Lentinula lateritia]|uniref:Uncharacterized protein n=1 Tax=Lentinula lateritia TaxID=40482 RepID=A0ABQ8VUG4_9AGAR|nr:hypothetical protein C8R41DRAFT_32055 [Lentinula lateritia]
MRLLLPSPYRLYIASFLLVIALLNVAVVSRPVATSCLKIERRGKFTCLKESVRWPILYLVSDALPEDYQIYLARWHPARKEYVSKDAAFDEIQVVRFFMEGTVPDHRAGFEFVATPNGNKIERVEYPSSFGQRSFESIMLRVDQVQLGNFACVDSMFNIEFLQGVIDKLIISDLDFIWTILRSIGLSHSPAWRELCGNMNRARAAWNERHRHFYTSQSKT